MKLFLLLQLLIVPSYIHSFLLFVTFSPPPCCASVFGVEPDLTREGGSIPVTLTFQEATGRNVMLLPVGSSDDGAHSQNEKINRYFFFFFVTFLSESLGLKEEGVWKVPHRR